MQRFDLTDAIYVEAHPNDRYVVSWPGGHRPNCQGVHEMLGALHYAIEDELSERATPRQLKAAKSAAHDTGYRKGWDDAKKHVKAG